MRKDKGAPEPGKVYALTGATGGGCISNGHSWADSEVKVYSYEKNFKEYIEKVKKGNTLEIDAEMFYYFLEVIPPAFMARPFKFHDGLEVSASFGFAEGIEPITVFWKDGSHDKARYFCRLSKQIFI